jgi:hypothetical protein
MRNFMICPRIIYYSDDQVKVDEIGRACDTYEGGEVRTNLRWGYVSETDNLENVVVSGRIILKWCQKKLDVKTWTGLI